MGVIPRATPDKREHPYQGTSKKMVFGWGKSQEEVDAENAAIQEEASICRDYSANDEEKGKMLVVRRLLEETRSEWGAAATAAAAAAAAAGVVDNADTDAKEKGSADDKDGGADTAGEKGEADERGYDVLSDMMVLRYLRGNKGVVEKTAHMLGKFISWSREMDIRNITEEDVQDVSKTKLVVSNGRSRYGGPCVWVLVQRLNKCVCLYISLYVCVCLSFSHAHSH